MNELLHVTLSCIEDGSEIERNKNKPELQISY